MGRHYNRATILSTLYKLKHLERSDGVKVQIGADLIVGFPGESEADFLDTLSLVESGEVSQLHAFPFSAHVEKYNVPAGKFPNQVEETIKYARLDRLLEEGKRSKLNFEQKNHQNRFRLLWE